MAAANFWRDVHELMYEKHEDNQRINTKIREKKEKQIKDFMEAHGSAPLQRTDEWFLMRNNVIGASELAALVGMSPFQNFEGLKRKKKKQKQLVILELVMLVGDDIRRRCSKIRRERIFRKNKRNKHLREAIRRLAIAWKARCKSRQIRNC